MFLMEGWFHVMSDTKESHPIAVSVNHEPSFNWWVPYTLKKGDFIIALVKNHSAKYLKCIHKFGIECPKTAEDALDLDKQNGNTMWADAISKEMKNI